MKAMEFCKSMRLKAAAMTRGRRNIEEMAAKVARMYKVKHGTGAKSGCCVRIVGKNLGTSRFSDYRNVLDIIQIVKETEKLYIGSSGERVKKDSVVFFEQEEV